MSDSTWDDYLEAGGTDDEELVDLADVVESQAEALEDQAAGLEELKEAEWTAEAERDVDYADQLDVEGQQHLESAEDALAQGDTAGAEWELGHGRLVLRAGRRLDGHRRAWPGRRRGRPRCRRCGRRTRCRRDG